MSYNLRLFKRDLTAYVFLLPALVLIFSFTYLPMINSFFLSFTSWDMVTSVPKFVGLRNYNTLFSERELFDCIRRTVVYAIVVIPITMSVGLVMASLLEKNTVVNNFFRILCFLPLAASSTSVSAIWLYIYNPQYGILNQFLYIFGFNGARWLNDPSIALYAVAAISVWKQLGFCVVVYIAGLKNIDSSVLEAASIDGANLLQRFFYIKLPLLSPTLFMLLILQTIDVLQVFGTINVMTQGGPNNATSTILILLYNYAFKKYQIGYASAIACVLFVLVFCINIVQLLLEKKVNYQK